MGAKVRLIKGTQKFKISPAFYKKSPTGLGYEFNDQALEQRRAFRDNLAEEKDAEMRRQLVEKAMSKPLPGVKTVKSQGEKAPKQVSSPKELVKMTPTQWTPQVAALFAREYKPKKVWPPDFNKLSDKEQFRLERKHKRRVRLATARPNWDRYVRLAQLFSVSFVAVYTVFWMDWKTENPPFEGVRRMFREAFASFSPDERRQRRTSGESDR